MFYVIKIIIVKRQMQGAAFLVHFLLFAVLKSTVECYPTFAEYIVKFNKHYE